MTAMSSSDSSILLVKYSVYLQHQFNRLFDEEQVVVLRQAEDSCSFYILSVRHH